MIIHGNIVKINFRESNRLIYDSSTAELMIEHANNCIKEGKMLGELGHDNFHGTELSLNNVSHKVNEVHLNKETQCIEGTIEILDTPKGRDLLRMIDNNPEKFHELFRIAPRGIGIVDENGNIENYKLHSFDIVRNESNDF